MSNNGYEEIADLTAMELGRLYRLGELSPLDATRAALARIEACNSEVNAYCHVAEESALESAKASEQRWLKGEALGPIDGVPSSIKDLTKVAGMPIRSGSLTSTDELATEDAPFSARMREAGAVILGKTTTPEFGWKGVTDSRATGVTRNPWDTGKTAGGSSGGAAAAAALNMGVLHQGSDAGGSIRIPGGFCGVFGIKPTFGYIPQWPASAMTTLSHLGPMTRTVEDSLLMMDAVAQPDHRDWYSDRKFDGYWIDILDRPLEGLKVAYSPTLGYVNVDPGVRACVDRAVATLIELGAEVEEVDPGFSDPLEMFSTLWFAGAGKVVSGMSEAQRDLLDPGFRAIGEQGMKIDIVDYMKAVDARAALGIKMGEFHQQYDLLVTPTLPITAFDAGRDTTDDSQKYWMEWTPFSYPFNLTQQPASTSPCGLVDGLPVGLQIVGAKGADALVLNACRRLERALPMQWLSRPKAGSRG
ncbi:amidase [Marinobacterium lutimaris]|uniref:Aspartyl-tRNA(Asn)/glutamyl-tRNA(Gln) amidotransferase subunit A n=1 Tax=Marinobacterium lutimaris TaxID=568106 RepID=A0A1H6BK13_9GAMM|nr:amidase [Marinobacterium lutimaris]SEG61030.1 aspartyl-tRNA(Asn)/glutamyl-tRNA(Gln) amidotransferase subunit A [Marinobacterium lutimaris]